MCDVSFCLPLTSRSSSRNLGPIFLTVISVHEITFLRVVDVLRLVEPLEALHSDGEAERHEEDRVHQGAQHLGAGPPEGVLKWWYSWYA